ncbi:MAG: hypothetical protein EOP49_10460 [Sphingobacteriales bacterium]|nr:MAG: hypothetical protein EOP49_10460 [Sphingobacteriales bacterium]
MRLFAPGLLILLTLFSCQKTETKSPLPNISFTGMTPGTVQSGKPDVTISFTFEDGDADVDSIFVFDSRDTDRNRQYYPWPNMESVRDPAKGLTGAVNLTIRGQFLIVDTPSVQRDSVRFEVFVKDRKNNESNHFTTDYVELLP